MIDKRLKYKEGGPMKKIKGQDHMLAYITPSEKNLLIDLGGQETMTPEGILAYPPSDNYGGTHGSGKSSDTGGTGRPNMADIAGPVTTSSPKADTTPDTKPDARDAYIAQMYTNVPKPTITLGATPRGLIKVPTTYTKKRQRRNVLNALNKKGISSFDPRAQKKYGITPFGFFAPETPKKKGFLDYTKQALGILSFLNPGTTIAKVGNMVTAYDKLSTLSALAKDYNITDKDVLGSLTSSLSNNFTGFNTTSKGPKGPPDDIGEGNDNIQNELLSEYLLLLQRMEKGLLSAGEQGRFNTLKSRLGKADGGIMSVNMNKGGLGETLYG